MRPLFYSINVTLDGCCDHQAGVPDEEMHRYSTEIIGRADALLFGRTIYQLMESAFRPAGESGERPEWMTEWMLPFAKTMHAAKKYVVSDTLEHADWNAEILRGDKLRDAVVALKQEPGNGIYTGGVTLPRTLAEWGLIDEFEFIVQPRIAGHGPSLFAGLTQYIDLKLVGRREFSSGAVALRYVPRARG